MSQFNGRRAFLRTSMLSLAVLPWRPAAGSQANEQAAAPDEMASKAVAFLKPRQSDEGSWSPTRKEPGITALVLTGLLRTKRVTPSDPLVGRGLAFLEQFLGPKGGLSEAPHSVYSTSVALMAFKEANEGSRYDRIIKGGQDFLKQTQIDEGEGKSKSDPAYGGLGYGGERSRPDLSNTAFFMEALRDSGLPADDPALQKALLFVSRSQNLKSEFNDQPWAGKVNDGGFVYVAPGGADRANSKKTQAKAGESADGGLRSSAAMTYSGLKSMIHAGLSQDDPRVKAALGYIAKHYTLDENPGQGERGLYYYYQTFAKAMALLGKDTFVDSSGKSHDWRAELIAALTKRQSPNGSWVNRSDTFMEGDPHITTSYVLLALASARKTR